MSVPSQTPYNIYTANGLTTVFAYQFMIMTAGDLDVSVNGTSITGGFTVQGAGQTGGGQVVFTAPPANGDTVMLLRKLTIKRDTDYQDNGDLLAETINADFDRLWLAMQQVFLSDSLSLKRPLLGGPYNAGGLKIVNLQDPTNPQDAATKAWVDLQYSVPTSEAKQAAAEAKEARDESREIADKFGDVDGAISVAEAARDAAQSSASSAGVDADRAEAAAESAEAVIDVKGTYPDIAQGLANTVDGDYFRVIVPATAGTGILFIWYRNVAGSAVYINTEISEGFVRDLESRIPKIQRSGYWGGITAVDGTLGVAFRESDNRPIFGNGGDILSIFPQHLRTGYWGGIVAKNDMVGVVFRESDNRPLFGNGGDVVGRIEKLEQINPISASIAHAFGNSKTAGTGGTPYPTQLAGLIGGDFSVVNYGIGGQRSGQIAMRMGAIPTFITVSGDAIPAASGTVSITQINGVSATAAPAYPSQDVRLLSTNADNVTRTIDGWLCGVKCRITRTASGDNNNTKTEVYTLTALEGTGVRCLPGSIFVPDYALQDYSGVEMWIDAGINDFRSGTDADLTDDVEAIRANVDAMVDFAERSGRNIILLSLTADNYSTEFLGGIRYRRILELNNHWSQKYPNYYARGNDGLDLRETLVANYNPAIALDVIDYGHDITPSSLRSDDRHPNTVGYGIYASVAYEFRQRRGY
ncbi:TPA: hypothetical protein MAL23_004246 [Klebsiella variicola]|nr:hypothetical protein [Klebsiella variicola]